MLTLPMSLPIGRWTDAEIKEEIARLKEEEEWISRRRNLYLSWLGIKAEMALSIPSDSDLEAELAGIEIKHVQLLADRLAEDLGVVNSYLVQAEAEQHQRVLIAASYI